MPLRRNRDYMLVWAGQGVSEFGSQISTVAYPLLVLALTHSPAKAGVVGLAATLPLPLLAPSATTTLLTRARFQPERTEPRGNLVAEFTSGLRWLWQQPLLRTCSLLTAAANPTWRALYLLLVVLAKRHGASSDLVGVMFAMIAAGGLLGGVFASSKRAANIPVRTAVVIDTWTTALLLLPMLIAQGTLFTALLIALIEFPAPLTNSAVEGLRGTLAPEHMQARVHAAAGTLSQSLGWAGPLLIGIALEQLSSDTCILLLFAWSLLAALGSVLLPSMRSSS